MRARLLAPVTAGAAVPVPGTTADGQTFAGTLTVQRFITSGGALQAVGQLAGTFTNPTTGATTALAPTAVTAPAAAVGGCTIFDLTLGPLSLNLLGNLLNGGGPLSGIAALLNRILGAPGTV